MIFSPFSNSSNLLEPCTLRVVVHRCRHLKHMQFDLNFLMYLHLLILILLRFLIPVEPLLTYRSVDVNQVLLVDHHHHLPQLRMSL